MMVPPDKLGLIALPDLANPRTFVQSPTLANPRPLACIKMRQKYERDGPSHWSRPRRPKLAGGVETTPFKLAWPASAPFWVWQRTM